MHIPTKKKTTAPMVVVTLKPIHSLVVGIMKGVGKPELIFDGKQNPHSASLKPSQIKTIKKAVLFIWIGPNYETGLNSTLTKLIHEDQRLELMQIDDLTLYRPRKGELWAGGKHAHHHHHHGHPHNHSHSHEENRHQYDPHIWLDPRNAKAIVRHIAKVLIKIDPKNKEIYRENWFALHAKIDKMIGVISKKIKPAQGVPYLVFHDSTQYFDRYFQTKAVGSVVIEPSIPVSAKHLDRLYRAIQKIRFQYLFLEPQTSKRSIAGLLKKPELKTGIIDPTGVFVKAGESAYFDIMHHLADNLTVRTDTCNG